MKAEIKTLYECPICETEHDREYDAEGCCDPKVRSLLRCSECDESFEDDRSGKRDAENHLQEHIVEELGGVSPKEIYLEALLFGKPPLGEWVTTMEAETEFLIPPLV